MGYSSSFGVNPRYSSKKRAGLLNSIRHWTRIRDSNGSDEDAQQATERHLGFNTAEIKTTLLFSGEFQAFGRGKHDIRAAAKKVICKPHNCTTVPKRFRFDLDVASESPVICWISNDGEMSSSISHRRTVSILGIRSRAPRRATPVPMRLSGALGSPLGQISRRDRRAHVRATKVAVASQAEIEDGG
jgi:hypothetical protein